jgi:hypothetical protein
MGTSSSKKKKDTEYSNYDQNEALILAKQNAGTIQVIKDSLNKLTKLKEIVTGNTTTIADVQAQVVDMAEAQNDLASDMVGTEPLDI